MRIEDSIYKYGSILKTTDQIKEKQASDTGQIPKQSFEDLLKQKMQVNELTFSKHAQQRLEQRDIELSKDDLQKLSVAVKKAEEKGVNNTLVLTDKAAFIINVSNNVVITAMGGNDMKENVFTQIDGAVII